MIVLYFKRSYIYVQSSLLQHHPEIFSFSRRHQASHPQPPSLGRCDQVTTETDSPDPSKSRRPGPRRTLTSCTRFQAAITVPKEATQTLISVYSFFLDQNIGYVKYWIYIYIYIYIFIVGLFIFSADTAHQARVQGPFWLRIHPCLHHVCHRERYCARQMLSAAAVCCSSSCCCAAATAAAAAGSATQLLGE